MLGTHGGAGWWPGGVGRRRRGAGAEEGRERLGRETDRQRGGEEWGFPWVLFMALFHDSINPREDIGEGTGVSFPFPHFHFFCENISTFVAP